MSETGDEFSARKAVEYLQSVVGYEEALRRRTEGITWMVWGLTMPGIFLTYALAGAILDFDAYGPLLMGLWVPWVVAGWLATAAVWRSAGLVMGTPGREGLREGILHMVIWIGLMFGGWTIALFIVPHLSPALYPTLIIGTIMILWGATPLSRLAGGESCREGRMVSIGAGLVIFTAAVLLALLGVGHTTASVASAAVTGTATLLGGFYETMRG